MNALARLFISAVALLGAATAATAQDRAAITLQAGVITGDNAQPLDSFRRPVFVASVQRVFKQHLVVEGEVSYWTLEQVIEHGPHNITGPQGIWGTVTGSRVIDSHRYWNAGANVLLKSTGRVRVFGGGGAGLSTDRNEYRSKAFGCSASLDRRICEEFRNVTGRGPIVMLRALGGLEVPITGTFELVGTVGAEKTAWEDRQNWLGATAGVRFSFN